MIREVESGLARRLAALRADLGQQDPSALAQRCGVELVNNRLEMTVWQTAVYISTTDFVARNAATGVALDLLQQLLVATYLQTSDGTGPAHAWVAFTELPDGRFYTRAFQGYTGRELAQKFGNDVARFSDAAVACGGTFVPFADVAFRFQALPYVPILVVCWLGDEDFPSSYKILFDAHSGHHLPTDGCAILGSLLTRRLLG